MKNMSAREAKDGFVVVVLSVEEYERLKAIKSKRARA
jgi:hypothetical protein